MARKFKGKSLVEFKSDYVVVDIETSDIDYFYGEILEIAAYRYKDFKLYDTFESLIKPIRRISSFTTNLTGITEALVSNSPDIKSVLEALDSFLKEDDVIIGHNVNFDVNYIYDAYMDKLKKPLTNDFIDTLKLSRRLIKDSKNHKLGTLAKYFDIVTPTHRAVADVLTTQELYVNLKAIYDEDPSKINLRSKASKSTFDLESINGTINLDHVDKENYFYNLNVCFTGRMDFFTKKEAAQTAAYFGAKIQNDVTPTTDLLILGNLEYQKDKFGKKSNKYLKAEQYDTVDIMTEISFIELLNQQ